jgi:hypothetical protein
MDHFVGNNQGLTAISAQEGIMSHLIELDPTQLVLVTDLMDAADRAGQIPAGKGMAWASVRQQLANPQETDKVVAQIASKALQDAEAAKPVVPTGLPSTPISQPQ